MADILSGAHSHVFLGEGHEQNERRTWTVIVLCSFMMVAEIVGGLLFGSIALVADGLHMSTHASALLLAALAYRYARRHADDPRFSFGTGKLGDLAGFSSAIVLAMIAILIGYEAVSRLFAPVPISFNEAIPIAVLGLIVNIVSVLLLSGGGRHHARRSDRLVRGAALALYQLAAAHRGWRLPVGTAQRLQRPPRLPLRRRLAHPARRPQSVQHKIGPGRICLRLTAQERQPVRHVLSGKRRADGTGRGLPERRYGLRAASDGAACGAADLGKDVLDGLPTPCQVCCTSTVTCDRLWKRPSRRR